MKKVLAMTSSVLLMSGSVAFAADAAKLPSSIAVINVQQVFQQSPRIESLNKKMQDQFKDRQEKLMLAQKTLQEERTKLDAGTTMSQKDKDALQKKIGEEEGRLTKDAANFQQDLRKEQNKVMKTVLAQLNDVVSSVAKKNNYNMVLDSQAVVYGGEQADITKEVTKEFNK